MDGGRRWRAWRRRGERERWWRGQGVGVAYGRRGEREVRWGPWGEGEVDMGRLWRALWRLGERERRERCSGGSWWRLGVQARREWVVEAPGVRKNHIKWPLELSIIALVLREHPLIECGAHVDHKWPL